MKRPFWWPRGRTPHPSSETVIFIEGAFDSTAVPAFRASVTNALETHSPLVTVDAHALTFIDSTGLAALLRARREASNAGAAFRLRNPSTELRRVAEIAGIESLLADE